MVFILFLHILLPAHIGYGCLDVRKSDDDDDDDDDDVYVGTYPCLVFLVMI